MRSLDRSLFVLSLLVTATVGTGCGPQTLHDAPTSESLLARLETTTEAAGWSPDFPSEADLEIILGTDGDAEIPGYTVGNDGNRLLPPEWVRKVSEAFYPTEVGDALDYENEYEDWRLVSLRVTPCGPVGLTPDQDIDSLCWPAVRLVWQPVVRNLQLIWGATVPTYADDRAIHAIHPLVPRDAYGAPVSTHTRDEVVEHLQLGRSVAELPTSLRASFERERDTTALWLLTELHDLRDQALGLGSWQTFATRPELMKDAQTAAGFSQRLTEFLAEVAVNEHLAEMTAFSLPEGREPAQVDLWVFVAFDGNRGNPVQKNLNVIGRFSGQELVDIGPSESVGVGFEDLVVEEALAAGNPELEASLILGVGEIVTKGEMISDPYEFLVPNTSCASCHRLNNDLRFNFHALSGFENNEFFVSPRVVKDVQRELAWVRYGGR